MNSALEATIQAFRNNEIELKSKIENLQMAAYNLKLTSNSLKDQVEQAMIGLAKLLTLYDNFSTLHLKRILPTSVSFLGLF